EGGFGEGDGDVDEQVVAAPAVEGAGGDAGDDLQVARRSAAHPGLALALEADARTVLGAGGDLHLDLGAGRGVPAAVALGARVVDDRAVAAAARAGLAERERPDVAAHDAAALAVGAQPRAAAGPGAAAAAL